MPFLNSWQIAQLLENGKEENRGKDHIPVAFLGIPHVFNGGTWLLTELYTNRPHYAFGSLKRIGMNAVTQEFDLTELYDKIVEGKRILFDEFFEGTHPLSIFVKAANELCGSFHLGYDAKTLLKYNICSEQEAIGVRPLDTLLPRCTRPFESPDKKPWSPA